LQEGKSMLLKEWNEYTKKLFNTKFLINKFILDKKIYEFDEKTFLPFFYFLGKKIKANSILEIGSYYGLKSGCFILGGSRPKKYFCYDRDTNTASTRFAKKNLYQFKIDEVNFHHYNSKITMNHNHQSDVVIINDHDALLNVDFFTKLVDKKIANGIIIIDYPNMSQSTKIYLQNFTSLRKIPMLEFSNKNNSILLGGPNGV
jgi:predicted O-methyltransferase YrrM